MNFFAKNTCILLTLLLSLPRVYKIKKAYKGIKNIMEKKIAKVKMKQGTRGEIAEVFNITPEYVSMICSGKINNETAYKVRVVAVRMGGDAIYE